MPWQGSLDGYVFTNLGISDEHRIEGTLYSVHIHKTKKACTSRSKCGTFAVASDFHPIMATIKATRRSSDST